VVGFGISGVEPLVKNVDILMVWWNFIRSSCHSKKKKAFDIVLFYGHSLWTFA
jgi:hypothetical protein